MFPGKTQVSLIAAILKDDPPPVSTVQAMSPAAIDFVVQIGRASCRERVCQYV